MDGNVVRSRLFRQLEPIIGPQAAGLTVRCQVRYSWLSVGTLMALAFVIAAQIRPSPLTVVIASGAGLTFACGVVAVLAATRRTTRATKQYVQATYGFHTRFGSFRNAEAAYTVLRLSQLYEALGISSGFFTEKQFGNRFNRRRLIAALETEVEARGGPLPVGPPDPSAR